MLKELNTITEMPSLHLSTCGLKYYIIIHQLIKIYIQFNVGLIVVSLLLFAAGDSLSVSLLVLVLFCIPRCWCRFWKFVRFLCWRSCLRLGRMCCAIFLGASFIFRGILSVGSAVISIGLFEGFVAFCPAQSMVSTRYSGH